MKQSDTYRANAENCAEMAAASDSEPARIVSSAWKLHGSRWPRKGTGSTARHRWRSHQLIDSNPMTAAWSKGRYRHYPYYLCMTRGCEAKSKSVPRAKARRRLCRDHQDLAARGRSSSIWPRQCYVMLGTCGWPLPKTRRVRFKSNLRMSNGRSGNLLDRVVDASSPSVVSAYETRIEKLEREKIVLAERVARTVPPKGGWRIIRTGPGDFWQTLGTSTKTATT